MNFRLIIILIFLVIILVFYGFMIFTNLDSQGRFKVMERYQGPVPEGYDEEFFRETGITKPLE